MLNQLLKFTLVTGFLLWLRSRWKWLLGCSAVILAAMYAHGEFLAYVAALPPDSPSAAAAGDYISTAFFAKNLVILGALVTYFSVEVRATRRRRGGHRPVGPTPKRVANAGGAAE